MTDFRPVRKLAYNIQNGHIKKTLRQHYKKETREHSIDDEVWGKFYSNL